ncbi:MAG: sigma-70 family RNA polymerase sigma factor [Anaerolineaceae bacterium]|nr:sigma-70 family RNA polymerase sigma factor [Anaerolineaceae bacterium]
MRQAVAGDGEAFGRLALEVQDRLFRLAIAQGLSPADAAEAVQETLTRAWTARAKWRPNRSVLCWLMGIVMNVVREMRRHRRRRGGPLPAALAARPVETGRAERIRAMLGAVEALPERQRETIACRYLQQLGVRTTAQVLGCAEGTVKAATAAALANLRKLLDGSDERRGLT